MSFTFDFMKEVGVMWEEDYRPYTAGDDEKCEHKADKAIKIKEWRQVVGPSAMRGALRNKGPLSVSFAAGSKFYNYSSGEIKADDKTWCSS